MRNHSDLPEIVHHKATLDGMRVPPNTLEAVNACLSVGAQVIEVDATALANDDYLLVHDYLLETETTGVGLVAACSAAEARELYVQSSSGQRYHAALLSDVVRIMVERGGDSCLQVDYKSLLPFAHDEPLRRLIKILEPLGQRVIVSSIADWQLRQLRTLAPNLQLGLDIQFYLDWHSDEEAADPHAYPHHQGAYGYWDEHPLSLGRIWHTSDYLRDRSGMLLGLVPKVNAFFVRYHMLVQSLADGFNWAEVLHQAGVKLDAWTMDIGKPTAEAGLKTLVDAGVDMVTTNTPVAMRVYLEAHCAG